MDFYRDMVNLDSAALICNVCHKGAFRDMQMRTAEDRSRLELKGLEAANAAESAALPGQLQVLPAKSPARAQG